MNVIMSESGPGPAASSCTVPDVAGVKYKVPSDKRTIFRGDQDAKISLKSFVDFKLSRSQLRRLTDLLEVTEDCKEVNCKSHGSKMTLEPRKDETVKIKTNSFNGNGVSSLDTIQEVKEDDENCISNEKANMLKKSEEISESQNMTDFKKFDHSIESLDGVSNSKDVMQSPTFEIPDDSDEDTIIDVVGVTDEGNLSKEYATIVITSSQTSSNGVSLSSKSNWKSNEREEVIVSMDDRKDASFIANSHIASQQFQCMLCDDENKFIPLDEILIHRWQHYKALMTFKEYLQGLDKYPIDFRKPHPLIANITFSSSKEDYPETFSVSPHLTNMTKIMHEYSFSPVKSHNIGDCVAESAEVETAPSYAVEVTVTTDQHEDTE